MTDGSNSKTQSRDRFGDDPFVAQQHRVRDPVFLHLIGRPDHLFVLSLGERNPLWVAPGFVHNDLHHLPGFPESGLERFAVACEIHLAPRGTARNRRLSDGRSDLEENPRIDRFREDILGTELEGLVAVRLEDGVGGRLPW